MLDVKQSKSNYYFYSVIRIQINRYGTDNVHLLNVKQYESSSIYLNITVDEPRTNTTGMISLYNYTALLQGLNFFVNSSLNLIIF
jgi:hypothetical protein